MARTVDRSRLERLVEQLELLNPTPKPLAGGEDAMRLLLNEWQLVTTFKPGTADEAVRLARLYVRHTEPRRYVEAIELLEKVIADHPDHDEAKRLKRQAESERFSGGG